MFTAIYAEPQSEKEINNSLRLIIGAGMPKELWRDFATRYEVDILEFYGAAEGGLMVNRPGEGPIGSIGKAVSPYKAMIINNNQLCPPNVKGEIVFYHEDDSPIELEYFSNPKATLDKTREGKLWMGDVGIMDENGWFYFLYRKGNQIRKNGDFISAAFIEKELSVFPDISDVFVYGIPSSNGVAGEKDIVAAIVLNKKIFFDLTTFKQYCHKNLEKNHIPSFFQLVDAIPKTASEKPLERVLASQFNKNASNIFTV